MFYFPPRSLRDNSGQVQKESFNPLQPFATSQYTQYLYCTVATARGSVRSTRGLGPTMTARGQGIGISIGMLPQALIMSITVQKTSTYYTTEFDLEEGF